MLVDVGLVRCDACICKPRAACNMQHLPENGTLISVMQKKREVVTTHLLTAIRAMLCKCLLFVWLTY